MGTTSQKLTYLNDTKGLLKDSINSLGGNITSQTTFRNYATELDSIYSNLPKVSDTGSNISLSPTLKGRIKSTLKGNTFQQTYTGKNLLNATSNSHTFSTSDTNRLNLGIITLTAGTKYYISYTIENNTTSNTRNTPSLQLSGSSTSNYESANTNYNLTAGRKVWEFTPSESGTYNFGYWCNTPSNSVTVSNFMISTSNDTTYEPYVGGTASPSPSYPQNIQSATGLQTITISDGTNSQTKELNLGNIKLNKIGDYQDYITGTPDNWSIKRQIGSVVLDGTGQWSKATRTTYVNNSRFINHSIQLKNDANNIIVISDYFNGYSLLDLNINDSTGISPARNSASDTSYFLTIQISKNLLATDDVNGFKSWLSTHNTQVDYVLATETTEAITDTNLINQLNEIYYLMSYNGTTNITITSENLEMIMTASALKGEE